MSKPVEIHDAIVARAWEMRASGISDFQLHQYDAWTLERLNANALRELNYGETDADTISDEFSRNNLTAFGKKHGVVFEISDLAERICDATGNLITDSN